MMRTQQKQRDLDQTSKYALFVYVRLIARWS